MGYLASQVGMNQHCDPDSTNSCSQTSHGLTVQGSNDILREARIDVRVRIDESLRVTSEHTIWHAFVGKNCEAMLLVAVRIPNYPLKYTDEYI